MRHDRVVSRIPDPPRIGIVDYANVAPLIEGLDATWPLRRETPARLADLLTQGELDVAILPSIELARIPGVRAIPGLGIAADGRCDSVFLFTKLPLREVRSVTLDASSRTSSALARILLDREGAREITFEAMDGGGVADRLAAADATLLIGDPALCAEIPEGVTRLDLATEWKRHVGLPFVFACWATRRGFELTPSIREGLEEAAERGLARVPELARRESERTGLSAARLEAYFAVLQYRLDERHVQGLRAFLDEAWRVGILPARANVEFWR
jgi:chorismate dehydratase